MPLSKYIQVSIDGKEVELESTEQFPLSINYRLEDSEDFQKKKSSESFDVEFPATTSNQQLTNDITNPAVEDLTAGEVFKGYRPAVISANGYELLVGKAKITKGTHTRFPVSYTADFYGNNGDWMIDLKESTLFDFLKHINFPFTKQQIIDSWQFNGQNESLPFLFAPVRYRDAFDKSGDTEDYNMKPEYMKPALSKYWIIYWAFKSIGYRVQSDFFSSNYFRRQLMPWTWGNFLYSEGTRLNNLKFLAKSERSSGIWNDSFTGIIDLLVNNDSTNGAFDNNGSYNYDSPNKELEWTYLPAFDYGILEATFHLQVFVDATATANSDVEFRVQYFKNGTALTSGNGKELVILDAPAIGRRDFAGVVDDFLTVTVAPGDVISAKFYLHTFDSGTGRANINAEVQAWELDYFRIPLGGTIDFQNYSGFKKYKFLDFLRGVVDESNLSIQTDPINKIVVFEPTHPFSVAHSQATKTGGYFNGDFIDWSDKQDISKLSNLYLYSDYEREVVFKYKDDGNDGIVKILQERNVNIMGAGKYVFPERFKSGKKEVENRFFSAVAHYEAEQWKGLGTDANASPQLICLVPENISNTSRDEAQNTFSPKSVYYKGLVTNVGWVFDGEEQANFPFLFAVNYQTGGENDPILSYSDERIGKFPDAVMGKGLLRRFYLQRLAIMRNGDFYDTFFQLKNIDVTNWFHREHIICRGQRWELVSINNYKPLLEQSTGCELRKWVPISLADSQSVFPSEDNVLESTTVTGPYDMKYAQLKCLPSDIPK